ncbi:MAG: HAMP domain-containing protein, partial [Leptotrichia sp.]|nr:HAMP domain-containing protein [Leptotrichia sp.]
MNKISIKLKIMLWYMGLMTGLVILFLLIIFYMSEKIIHSYEYGYLKTTVESSFKEIYVKNGEIIVDNDMETKINTIQISVYNKNLGFVYGNNPLNFEYDDTFSDKKIIKTVKHQHEKWYVYESKKNYEGYGEIWIRGVMSAVGASQAIETVISISLIIFPFFLIFAGIIGYIITRNAFIPIKKIRSAAEKINEGNDLSQRINLGEGNDEIYTLANTFDTMFDRLQDSFEREVQFNSDVSHELRTPISVI